MKKLFLCIVLALAWNASAVTVDNDDTCDIAVMPAATLLLPYFEVDLDRATGETTLFTVSNVTNVDQIARVTLWTDYAYPVITFNLYLTGYDVQSINLFDVIVRGLIAPDSGTGTRITDRGDFSDANAALNLTQCDRLPGALDPVYVDRMQDAFTEGRVDRIGTLEGCEDVGGEHVNAIGYATVDVVSTCGVTNPTDSSYWTTLRYDNALIGDYQQVSLAESSAQGGPMVHIRAIPEGGTAESRARLFRYDVFDRTFYSQYQAAATPHLDGRQPLPAQFSTRWILGTAAGYETFLKIWRESGTSGNSTCGNYSTNGDLAVREIVTFDENENATADLPSGGFLPDLRRGLPASSRTSIGDNDTYPQMPNGAPAGWLYLNLDREGSNEASQAWVVASMRALGRFSTDIEATALGNGCSEPARVSEISRFNGATIGPARNDSGIDEEVSTNNDDGCDIAQLPAATLLLPYFEVDLTDRAGPTTLVTLTNVTAQDQIARVTLWTDFSVPVVSFNVFLTGYDVQSLNLFDVLSAGAIGTSAGGRGAYSDTNPRLDIRACDQAASLPAELRERLVDALMFGVSDECSDIGNPHENAVGYATIDVVRNCDTNGPLSPEYWRDDIAYDNVLTGDYQYVELRNNSAGGSPLVHIRAVPEDGEGDVPFERTFYSGYQTRSAPKRDGRQPLPSLFAARWINGGASGFKTSFLVWRESATGARGACGMHPANLTVRKEIVVFDEAENGFTDARCDRCSPPLPPVKLPSTSRVVAGDSSVFPAPLNGAVAGWAFFNLDDDEADDIARQAWVVASMSAEGRYSVLLDANVLGNGCSAPADYSELYGGSTVIGPPQ